jgi:hypothetical protein
LRKSRGTGQSHLPRANRLAHRYGFGCAADSADLFEDAICTKAGLNETWLGDLDRRAPGLFQVARQIVA